MAITDSGFEVAHPSRMALRLAAAALRDALCWPVRVWRARQLLGQLGSLCDHELRDIGLTRQDLRDITGLRPGHDPSIMLEHRARQRRRP